MQKALDMHRDRLSAIKEEKKKAKEEQEERSMNYSKGRAEEEEPTTPISNEIDKKARELDETRKALSRIAASTALGTVLGSRKGGLGAFFGSVSGLLRGVAKEEPHTRSLIDRTTDLLGYELTDGKAARMKETRLKDFDLGYYRQLD